MSALTPIQKVSVQDWMESAAVSRLMSVLNSKGQALFVGGCVRNMLIGKDVDDIDIATTLTPDQVIEALSQAKIKHVPTGIEHGTVTAVLEGRGYEITTLRKDVETDGRRAVVAFSTDWFEDAQRRDFTMNTLLADMDGHIFDPLGRGLQDLEARKLIFVGEAEQRIREDYLRILRFFRFHALYGEGEPDDLALKACSAHAKKIKTLSKERITQEFLKIISAESPVPILNVMFEHGVLKEFDPGFEVLKLLGHVCDFQNRYGLAFVAPRLLVLAGLDMKRIDQMHEYLILPKVFLKDMQAVLGVLALPDLSEDHAVKVAVYKFGRIPAAQSLIIEVTQDRVMNGFINQALEVIQNWDVPNFPLSGNDLIDAGIAPGPDLGKRLSAIEDWWISEAFQPEKRACLDQLSR